MATPPHLDHEQRRILEQLSGHPLPHNLKWPHVISLLKAMGEVTQESDDRIRVKYDGHTEVFRTPKHGDVDADTVVKLRHFLLGTMPTPDESA
jgi:hypothetical protein